MFSKPVNPYLRPLIGAIALLSFSSIALAESGLSIEQRLKRLENLLANQVLMEQSQRMEQIQQELASMRELVERQEHQLNLIKQRQRNLYQDMDRRLQDVEIKGGGMASSAGSNAAIVPMAIQAPTSSVPPPNTVSGTEEPAGSQKDNVLVSGDKDGKSAYSSAFNTLKQGKYKQAIAEFTAFQQSYPGSVYSANVHYWLGRAYSLSRDYQSALSEFNKVEAQFPKSNKVKDAMLGVAFTYYEIQDWASAKTALNAVISKYPSTTAARKAKERLERIKREGH